MKSLTIGAAILLGALSGGAAVAQDAPPPAGAEKPTEAAAPPAAAEGAKPADAAAGGAAPAAGEPKSLADAVKAPKGTLKNPFTGNAEAVAEGQKIYLKYGCNGCHGGGGGGGMCPPLTNDTFVYGSDDDTLFRLVALGSDGLQKAGYTRLKKETVVGPMPLYGGNETTPVIIKTDNELWKIIAWMRTNFRGSEKTKNW